MAIGTVGYGVNIAQHRCTRRLSPERSAVICSLGGLGRSYGPGEIAERDLGARSDDEGEQPLYELACELTDRDADGVLQYERHSPRQNERRSSSPSLA